MPPELQQKLANLQAAFEEATKLAKQLNRPTAPHCGLTENQLCVISTALEQGESVIFSILNAGGFGQYFL